MRRGWTLARACALLLIPVAAACGKKGNPLPPLRPVPARVADLSAVRTDVRVTLHFTVPATNTDGTEPPAIDHIDVFRVTTAPGAAAPAASVIAGDVKNRIAAVAVKRPAPASATSTDRQAPAAAATAAPADTRPEPGGAVTVVDALDAPTATGARHYVAVPVAGAGKGRPGSASAVISVAMGDLPAAPTALAMTNDETQVTITWEPAAAGQSFTVLRQVGPTFDPASATELTAEPLTKPTFSVPVQFGQPLCVAVRPLKATGSVRADGPPSAPSCYTPVDRFPPPPPADLQAIQEGAAVTLIWNRSDAADLAGYVVLRGEGTTGALQPLMRTPLAETTYKDLTVRTGMTYTYAVYAVDTAPTPNVSPLSDRQTVVVR